MSIAEKLTTIAENEQKVYNAGYNKGKAEGGDTDGGIETFFDSYLRDTNGYCDYMFAGKGWKNKIFKPTIDIKPVRAQNMFSLTGLTGDLAALCEQQGITIDFSNCKLFNGFSSNASGITRFGAIDISKATDTISFIYNTSLITIDKLIVSETTKYNTYAFEGCKKLTNLIVEGVIAQNNFNVQWCNNLTVESLRSIINCLQDKSEDTSGTIWKVTIGGTNYAKLESEDLEKIEEKGWVFV
ncbi:MAG: hypothetical protein IJP34_04880 [Clostridia bacterium]|nr:hypothetical protein [Clostridia bacterium]